MTFPCTLLSLQTARWTRRVQAARPRPPSERAPRTRARNWWSWRRSSTSAATSAGRGAWRWPACSTFTRGRSRSGSRTGGWSRKRTSEVRASLQPSPPPLARPRPPPPPREAPLCRAWVMSIWEGITNRPPLRSGPSCSRSSSLRTRQTTLNIQFQASRMARSLMCSTAPTQAHTHQTPTCEETTWAARISHRAAVLRKESCKLPNWPTCSARCGFIKKRNRLLIYFHACVIYLFIWLINQNISLKCCCFLSVFINHLLCVLSAKFRLFSFRL